MPERVKVAARFLDGRVLKGYTQNFDPQKPIFELHAREESAADLPIRVRVADLKAVFFVRDFDGNPTYNERKEFDAAFTGRRLSVQFTDGDVLVGTTFSYDPSRPGFFLFPPDPACNNEKVYVNAAAVAKVTKLPMGVRTA
ncbi:MAG TPA: hypothetical protein VM819_14290 [Vicinamibacterales bacterium]|jgi:hypothetical protein|nr:hypothetical protein [Vicinamibacterales bacterium]